MFSCHREETTPTNIWPLLEMAANGLSWVPDIPDGFVNTELVPYDLAAGTVYMNTTVTHLSNKYCNLLAHENDCRYTFQNFISS